MVMGLPTLEPFDLRSHHASIARRDISSFHTRHSQLIIAYGVTAIIIALSSPYFKVGAWQVRDPLLKYLLSPEDRTSRGSRRSVYSGLSHKWEIFRRVI